MIIEIYSVFDVKAKAFGSPFFGQNELLAKRSVAAVVRDEDRNGSMLSKFPEDFDLYRLGSFDDQNGIISVSAQPEFLVKCSSLKL